MRWISFTILHLLLSDSLQWIYWTSFQNLIHTVSLIPTSKLDLRSLHILGHQIIALPTGQPTD